MSHKTGKSTLVLPERLLKRIDRLRGTIDRDKFHRACVDLCPKRKYTKILPKSETYIVREELREYEQDLVALLADLARLFPSLALYEPAHAHVRAAAGVTVVNIEVRSKVKTGDMVPVYVTVCNQAANEKTVKVTLADTSESIVIGRRTVTLLPDTSKIVRFDWKTRGFSLGDHILEAEVAAL